MIKRGIRLQVRDLRLYELINGVWDVCRSKVGYQEFCRVLKKSRGRVFGLVRAQAAELAGKGAV